MDRAGLGGSGYLNLDNVAEDRQVARRLPLELARRYHALPVAEDDGRITVAMADPDDPQARHAVVSALGSVACVVRADAAAIDSRLATVWGEAGTRPLRLVAGCFPGPVSGELWTYARQLAQRLGAQPVRAGTPRELHAAQADVVLIGEGWHPALTESLARAAAAVASGSRAVPSAVCVAPQPRWPVRRLLLVMSGESSDQAGGGRPVDAQAAIDWIARLAQPGDTTITVLAGVDLASLAPGQRERPDQGLAALLTGANPLGQEVRQVAHQLVERQLDATLRLRVGPPEWRLEQEIVEGDHDLIVLPGGHPARWPSLLDAEPASAFLSRIGRPILAVLAPPTGEERD